jgi:hypothetical protein
LAEGGSIPLRGMNTRVPAAADRPLADIDALVDLPVGVFVSRWRFITGEPPAILLSSRTAMIALLVESVPVAPLAPPAPSWETAPPADGTPPPG